MDICDLDPGVSLHAISDLVDGNDLLDLVPVFILVLDAVARVKIIENSLRSR